MIVKLTKIGNSQGVRIPKDYLQGFLQGTAFELSREGDKLILSPKSVSRKNWVSQMKKVAHEGDDDFILNEFDEGEWQWD